MWAVTISLAKRTGADAHRVVAAVMQRVDDLRGNLIPPGVEITVTRDYGETSNEKARELLTHLIVAIVSVTIVIGLFLGWRGGLVVFIAVPVTFALTLFVYYYFGYTLNRVTLFALIFVTGIVVDDSIIVVENIVRHFEMRKLPAKQAAITAVNEVGEGSAGTPRRGICVCNLGCASTRGFLCPRPSRCKALCLPPFRPEFRLRLRGGRGVGSSSCSTSHQ